MSEHVSSLQFARQMLPPTASYISASSADRSFSLIRPTLNRSDFAAMLSLLFFVTSALSSGLSASFPQESVKTLNDAPAVVPDSLFYYTPQRLDDDSVSWEDEGQRNFDMFERLGTQQAKRVHTGEQMSISIMNPLDVLRQKLLKHIADKKLRQQQEQIKSNYDYLRQIG